MSNTSPIVAFVVKTAKSPKVRQQSKWVVNTCRGVLIHGIADAATAERRNNGGFFESWAAAWERDNYKRKLDAVIPTMK